MAIPTSPGADQGEARINQTWFVAHEATPPEEFDLNLYPLHRRRQTRHITAGGSNGGDGVRQKEGSILSEPAGTGNEVGQKRKAMEMEGRR